MSALNPAYYITPEKDGWTVWRRESIHDTQQAAIDIAKRKAAQEGGSVEWEDGGLGRQGPVFPSKFGLFGKVV